ncbi:MAG: phytoene/squalene synthase family protein [Actinomycetota bacterium]|nr:phytoene/squalene synthase family protein [Actinomycetota bacterium]
MSELDAAGITDPRLRSDYQHCRRLAAGHGRTYFLATRLLPPERRSAVHALYGFARTADEIVDDTADGRGPHQRAAELVRFAADFRRGATAEDPSCRAVSDTARRYDLDPSLFSDFLDSMRADLTVTRYETFEDLMGYMHGSAAVIGRQLVPVLGTVAPSGEAEPYAARLGVAFQLTNFIRDVGEDLDRGRVYLPQQTWHAAGVSADELQRRVVTPGIRSALGHEIARARAIYAEAEPGIELLEPVSRHCVRTAFTLYGDILAAVEAADYRVLDRRVSVGRARRLRVALPGLVRALRARRAGRATPMRTRWP